MRKRFITLAALAALTLTLSACGNGELEAKAKDQATTITDLQAGVSSLEAQVASLEDDVATESQRARDAEVEVAIMSGRMNKLAERKAAVRDREVKVAGREAAVKKRETAVGAVEQAIEDSRLEPGTYLVPEEVTAGRYRVINDLNGSMCYMSQDRGDDIIDNLLEEAGRPVFTVVAVPGTTFSIDPDCGTVEKID